MLNSDNLIRCLCSIYPRVTFAEKPELEMNNFSDKKKRISLSFFVMYSVFQGAVGNAAVKIINVLM